MLIAITDDRARDRSRVRRYQSAIDLSKPAMTIASVRPRPMSSFFTEHPSMRPELKATILKILDDNRIMTLATLRPDGWPQATTVGFASDGLRIYFLCGADSQKAANLAFDDRVSADDRSRHHGPDGDHRRFDGGSRAARPGTGRDRPLRRSCCWPKYPEYRDMPMPEPGSVAIFALQPRADLGARLLEGFWSQRTGNSRGRTAVGRIGNHRRVRTPRRRSDVSCRAHKEKAGTKPGFSTNVSLERAIS